jgi:hypothetical protein
MRLPIDDVLPELVGVLRDGTRALLIAPPGAGKTTKVAPAPNASRTSARSGSSLRRSPSFRSTVTARGSECAGC